MQVDLRRGNRRVPEKILGHVERAGGGLDVGPERVAELVGPHRRVDPGPPARGGELLADRVRAHRRPDRLAEQVDQHEVAARGPIHPRPLERVGVERADRQEVQRHHPAAARLRHRPVRVVLPTHDVHMRPADRAAQRPGINQQMDIRTAQPRGLAAAQPRPRQQQHDQPVARGAARPEHRDDVGVRGSIHRPLRFVQPMPHPRPPRQPVLTTGDVRQVPIVGDLIGHRDQTPARRPDAHRVHHHPAHRGQGSR